MARSALVTTVLAVLVAVSGACDDPTVPAVDGVRTQLNSVGLVATNYRSEPIYYFAIERNIAARVDWAPCLSGLPCTPRLDPGASVTITYDQLMWGVDGSSEAIFYWWLMVPDEHGDLRPDSLRTVVVRR